MFSGARNEYQVPDNLYETIAPYADILYTKKKIMTLCDNEIWKLESDS